MTFTYCIFQNRIAKVVHRNDKDEIQFYEITASSPSSSSTSSSSNAECTLAGSIFIDGTIMDIQFRSKSTTSSSKVSKKRAVNGTQQKNTGGTDADEYLLAAILESGEVQVISWLSNSIINTITSAQEFQLNKVVAYEEENIYGVNKLRDLYQINAVTGKSTKIKVSGFDSLAIVDGKVYVGDGKQIDIGSITKNKFAKSKTFTCPVEFTKVENFLQDMCILSDGKSTFIFDTKTGDTQELVANENDKRSINRYVGSLQLDDESYLVTAGESALDIFTSSGKHFNTIHTNKYITNVFAIKSTPLFIWNDDNEDFHAGAFSIDQSQINAENGSGASVIRTKNVTNTLIDLPSNNNVNPLDKESLISSLTKSLGEEIPDAENILLVCSSASENDDIRDVVTVLSVEQSEKLFFVISTEMEENVTSNFTLSLWLKWVLLVHGGSFARNPNISVKNIQTQLKAGLKVMPHLYAIKGKLQLLKLQSELRSSAPLQDIDITTTVEDESMMYANGEVNDISA